MSGLPQQSYEELQARTKELEAKLAAVRVEVRELSDALGRRQLWVSEMSFLRGFTEGVQQAFDLLGERKDERVMVLNREATAVLRDNMRRYDEALTTRYARPDMTVERAHIKELEAKLAASGQELADLRSDLPHCSRCGVVLFCNGSAKEHDAAAKTLLRNLLDEAAAYGHIIGCAHRGSGATARRKRAVQLTACAACGAEAFLRGTP